MMIWLIILGIFLIGYFIFFKEKRGNPQPFMQHGEHDQHDPSSHEKHKHSGGGCCH